MPAAHQRAIPDPAGVRYNRFVAIERFLGVDLAWAESRRVGAPNESGVAVLDPTGRVLDAGWTRGLHETVAWIAAAAGDREALLFVDAPLVVANHSGQRPCETQVGQRYGRWKVSANTTNLATVHLAGVSLLDRLAADGWRYDAGLGGPPAAGRTLSECYPYTTLVGAPELGYNVDGERPRYKRKPKAMRAVDWKPMRAAACDELIRRLARLRGADPPLLLDSHPVSRLLARQGSPAGDLAYKHREDLLDALLCAWTAALWHRHGLARCQVLGPAAGSPRPIATIIAPATPPQRRPVPGLPVPTAG